MSEDRKNPKRNYNGGISDEQAVRGDLSRKFDHEMANEPLTPAEKFNNKKTKKRQ
ncbi:small acid-soluble spore protein O [Virgibacillus sp. DJP39]|uniref:small acid-soluble spore protein O n=1 Tax=Virgibacillus sp. DJP39 TaxID=3409790 RepID=UPI003BB5CB24